METGKPIVLIGFMATGKSTVGQIVAQRTGREFMDLDKTIEKVAGISVADIFRNEGEPGFRQRESEALRYALDRPNIVLATGGGAACREENLEAMLKKGWVVALSVSAEEVINRTGGASGRPLLDGQDDALGLAAELLKKREPFYARAHARVDTVGREPEAVADELLHQAPAGLSGVKGELEKQEN